MLYPLGFIIGLLSLSFWFYYKDSERGSLMRTIFFVAIGVYLIGWLMADAAMSFKFLMLSRDFLIMGVLAAIFKFLSKYPTLFKVGIGIVLLSWFIFWGGQMRHTFTPTEKVEFDTRVPLADDGELLVEVKPGKAFKEMESVIEKYDLEYQKAFLPKYGNKTDLDDYYLVNIPDAFEKDIQAIEAEMMATGLVDWIDENEIIQLDPVQTSMDLSTGVDFKVNDPDVSKLWGFEKMKVNDLYAALAKSGIVPQRKAKVFILDTGVDGQHEDLKDNYTSLNPSYDNDPVGHGTHCAGIAGAVTNNGIGIASLAPTGDFIEITSIKVLGPTGGGTQQSIIKGIIEAVDNNADVLSLSLGGPSTRFRQKAYEQAIDYAAERNAIVVVAAGNSNKNAKDYSPANTSGVIAVSAVDSKIEKASFSNTVEDLKMGVAAPGVQIFSTTPNNNYTSFNGTSMATPYVSGLIGLMKSINPDLNTRQVYKILQQTGVNTNDTRKTGKLIQPAAAIEELMD
ncbi:MAG: S8 family serine peptidase [Saprospiraceae bacterium]|nr:S8 family serine peptidase [Saprospiraceae bacterium]